MSTLIPGKSGSSRQIGSTAGPSPAAAAPPLRAYICPSATTVARFAPLEASLRSKVAESTVKGHAPPAQVARLMRPAGWVGRFGDAAG